MLSKDKFFSLFRKTKKPLGILVLGSFNFFILGVVALLFFAIVYLDISSQRSQGLLEELKKYFPEESINIKQFKVVIVSQIIISIIFIVSGLGLILRKEWARRLTLYFSFFMVATAFLSVMTNRQFITQAVLQVIYPGVLILYFTSKKIESYFIPSKGVERKTQKEVDG